MSETKNRYGLCVNKHFRAQFRPLSLEERVGLEKDLIDAGKAYDPIIVRRKTNEILDGHNRFEICEAHKLAYRIEVVDLNTEQECIAWIHRRQSHRRNLTQSEREASARLLYEQLATEHKKKKPNGAPPKKAPDGVIDQVAQATGESKRTTMRRLARAEQSDKLSPKIKADYESGKLKLNNQVLKALSGLPKNEQAACYAATNDGDYPTLEAALIAHGAIAKPPAPTVEEATPAAEAPPEAPQATTQAKEVADLAGQGAGEAIKACEALIRKIDAWGNATGRGPLYDKARAKVDDLYDHLAGWAKTSDEEF